MSKQNTITPTNAARLLLEFYGHDSLSYFALHEKKKYFFSSTGSSFLSYTVWHKIALVSGDPIGPKSDIPNLVKEFSYFTKGAKLTTCFIGIHANSLEYIKTLNFKILHAGEEAVLDLQSFNKQSLAKKVRRAERHIQHAGIVCKIFSRKELPELYLKQIEEISTEWLSKKGGKERGFSMTLGRIPDAPDENCEFVLAVEHEKVLGYLTFVPAFASHTLSLDASRRLQDSPNGLNEFLLLQAFEHYKKEGIKKISLNFATFNQGSKQTKQKLQKHIQKLLYKSLSTWYGTNKLYKFNAKFMPQWESRYIAFEKRRYIPYYLLGIMRTEWSI